MSARKIPKTWSGLIRLYSLRPIRDEAAYDTACDALAPLSIMNNMTKDQEDYLEALSTLVEAYENIHHKIDLSHLSPTDILKFLVEENNMSAGDLGRLLGDRTLGSKVLTGKRSLSQANIAALCKRFKVSADLFLPRLQEKKSGKTRRKRLVPA